MSNSLLTQTFRVYNPSSMWKITVKNKQYVCNYVKRKCVRVKGCARTVQTYLKLMLRPSGCTVPSWNISLISSCLQRMLKPRHKRIPRSCLLQEIQGCCWVRFPDAHQSDSWDYQWEDWWTRRFDTECVDMYVAQAAPWKRCQWSVPVCLLG